MTSYHSTSMRQHQYMFAMVCGMRQLYAPSVDWSGFAGEPISIFSPTGGEGSRFAADLAPTQLRSQKSFLHLQRARMACQGKSVVAPVIVDIPNRNRELGER